MKNKFKAITALSLVCAVAGASGTYLAFADGETSYYVCYSTENYSVRNANKMKKEGSEYIISEVSLNSHIDFYVRDNAGRRWYAANGKEMYVDESTTMTYSLKFNPDSVYSEEVDRWKATDCNITYRTFEPATYSLTYGSNTQTFTYNPYRTAYDEYYISSLSLTAGTTLSVNGKYQTNVEHDGNYRILFTPGERKNGKDYAYDEDGVYGEGSGHDINLYVESAPQYFYKTEGGDGYKTLIRNEDNIALKEYKSEEELFASGRDYTLKYGVYELEATGEYALKEDGNDNELTVSDAGWYELRFIDGGSAYTTTYSYKKRNLGGFYLAGEFNGYSYKEDGSLNKDAKYKLKLVESGDDDYDEDYEQYYVYLNVTDKDLKEGDVEFYITDGDKKYKNGTKYVSISREGRYKILFSDEKLYGNGRHYRYVLEEDNPVYEEIEISSVQEFLTFAEKCSKSADYSKNKAFYLTCDLDFLNVEFKSVGNFSGKFYGGYHKLANINLDKDTPSVFKTVTRDGSVERLTVYIDQSDEGTDYAGFIGTNYGTVNGINVYGTVKGNNYVGAVVGYNGRSSENEGSGTTDSDKNYRNGTIKNCKNYATVAGTVHTGGICGFNAGEITTCENSGKINYVKQSSSSSPFNLGGIAGYSAGKIVDCKNSAMVDGGSEALYVGGVCGLATGEIYFSFNSSSIVGRRYSGGIAGYFGTLDRDEDNSLLGGMTFEEIYDKYFNNDDNSFEEIDGAKHIIMYCINSGDVTSVSYAGGVLGYSDTVGLKISCCESTGNVCVTGGSYSGGIAGYAVGGSIDSCVTGGSVSAKGSGAGKYVGGIAGGGSNISTCSSVCEITGADFVGGIAGKNGSGIYSCWASVILIPDDGAKNAGNIAGATDDWKAANNKFAESFKYNYYVAGADDVYGGVGGVSYGKNYDYAAAPVSGDELAEVGTVAPLVGFNTDNKWRGFDSLSFPSPRYLTEEDECKEFGDDEEFSRLFNLHNESFLTVAIDNAQVLFTVTFLEWNEDNGSLFDDDGVLQKDNFEVIKTYRLPLGATLESPAFKWAELQGGKYIYDGGDASYFVSFPEVYEVTASDKIYAVYREIATTISTDDDRVLVEGVFDAQTKVKLVQSVNGYTLEFTLNGEKIEIGNVKVKFRPEGGADKKAVELFGADGKKDGTSEVSGKYLSFGYSDGDYFNVVTLKSGKGLPSWAWGLIGGAIGAALAVGAGWTTITVVRKKKAKKAAQAEAEAKPDEKADEPASDNKESV